MEVLHGPHKDDHLQNSDAQIFVINPEGLEWLLQVQKTKTPSGKTRVSVDLRRWKKLGFDTLIVDELSKFKHINTNRFKAMKLVLHTFSRRWGLTGSPAANGLMGLFGQCFMLDEGRTFGRYITQFRMKYFDQGYDGFSWTLKEGAEDLIYDRVRPLALRMGDELIDMPKLVPNNIKVQLPDKATKVYRELEKDLIARMDEGKVSAKNAATASLKCRQVASGGVYLDDEVIALAKLPKKKMRDYATVHDVKLDALQDLIEELQGTPLLIAYEFQHDLDRIRKRFGKDVPAMGGTGNIKAKDTKKIVDAWNAGEIPYIFAHPESAAHGLDGLQHAGCHVVWFSPTWDYELYDQFIRRIRRQGSRSKRVYVHHIIAEDTIDEVILGTLKAKKSGQNALFSALKKIKKSCK
jgi:SNF2 family DNA or RNA helicase